MTGEPPQPRRPSADLLQRLMAPAVQSVALQTLGSAATLGSALWVSWRMGLAEQGNFGLAKSWFDAAAVLGALGLPQGLLHLQYRRRIEVASLWPWLTRWLIGLALAGAVAAGVVWLAWRSSAGLAAAVLLSLPLAVGHLMARSLVLRHRGPAAFGMITALPALMLLAGVLAMALAGWPRNFVLLLLAVTMGAGVISLCLAWPAADGADAPALDAASRRELWQVSTQSWLQAGLGGLLAAGLLSVVALGGQGNAAVGAASLGLHLYQLFAVAAGYAAPLLFDRLARQDWPALPDRQWPTALKRAVAVLLGASVVSIAMALAGLLPAWSLVVGLMIAAGLAAMAARIHGTVLLARGSYVELSFQAAWRLVLALALTLMLQRLTTAATAVALALLVTETLSWWRSTHLANKVAR